mgnify:CR=1 FL=1
MKKFSLFLAAMLTVTIFGGCSGNQSSHSDEKEIYMCVSEYLYKTVETIAQVYKEEHPGVTIRLEMLSEEQEDEAKLKQMKTDIMSGKGPDLFILQARGAEADDKNFLFPNVSKAIESGVFCSLDDFLKKDKNWEAINIPEAILKAGTYNGRQYILPITIDLPMFVQEETDKVDVSEEKTLMDCMKVIQESGNKKALNEIDSYYLTSRLQLMESALDYEEQEVLFDKGKYVELANCLTSISLQIAEQQGNESSELSQHSGTSFFVNSSFEEENLDYQVLPTAMGKRTACVQSYGAVSSNAKEKETSYDFLRFFLDTERQGGNTTKYPDSPIVAGTDYPVNRDGFESYLNEKPAKEKVLSCFDCIEECVFLSQASRAAGEQLLEVRNRIIGGESPYSEKELKIFADEMYKKYEMILKE